MFIYSAFDNNKDNNNKSIFFASKVFIFIFISFIQLLRGFFLHVSYAKI